MGSHPPTIHLANISAVKFPVNFEVNFEVNFLVNFQANSFVVGYRRIRELPFYGDR